MSFFSSHLLASHAACAVSPITADCSTEEMLFNNESNDNNINHDGRAAVVVDVDVGADVSG